MNVRRCFDAAFWCRLPLLWVVVALAASVLLGVTLFWGDLNQDEGWYLYAARLVAGGQLPYRDFAFTQGPVMPMIYAWIQPLVAMWGLAAGRVFTGCLGILSAVVAALLARQLVTGERRKWAALLVFALVLCNVYQCYYFTMVKTYALTALFLTTGFLALSEAVQKRAGAAALLAGALMTLAACTRSSAAVAVLIPLVGLWWFRDRLQFRSGWRWFMAGAACAGLLALGRCALSAPDNFFFFVVQYHTLRSAVSMGPALAFKVGFLSRVLQAFAAAFVIGSVALVLRRTAADSDDGPRFEQTFVAGLMGVVMALVTLIHLAAPFPYDDYQVFVYPLLAVTVVALLLNRTETPALPRHVLLALFLIAGATLASPVNQDLFIQGRDRIWWRLKEQSPLMKIREVGRELRAQSRPGDTLLTQDPYLAVESGLSLPPGLEMGQFAYFPGLTTEAADRRHVFNRHTFEHLLRTCDAPLAAISGYAFAMESPSVNPVPDTDQAVFRQVLSERYVLVREVPYFGQAATTLRIYKTRSTPGTL